MRLSYRPRENTLRLTLDVESGDIAMHCELEGILDIAEQGRLVGVELDGDGLILEDLFDRWLQDTVASRYVHLEDDGVYVDLSTHSEDIPSQHVRTADVRLRAEMDASGQLVALSIPRHGHGYEISFPSGNR